MIVSSSTPRLPQPQVPDKAVLARAAGVVFFLGLAAVFAILGLVLVLQYAKGGNGVRVCSIVYASFAIVSGIFSLALYGLGLLIMIVSILVIVFAARRPSAEWFRRPRY